MDLRDWREMTLPELVDLIREKEASLRYLRSLGPTIARYEQDTISHLREALAGRAPRPMVKIGD